MGLFKKNTPPQKAVTSVDKRIVEELVLESLYLKEFENIGIPDKNLYVARLGGWYKNGESYDLFFNPPRGGPCGMDSIIHIIGQTKKVSVNPERWEKDFPSLENIALDLNKVVKGDIGGLYEKENMSPEYLNIACYINEPEMEMTHKGIAEVGRKLKDNVGFQTIGVKSVTYKDVVPKDASNRRSLGFNIPTCCLNPIRIWKQ